MIESARRGQVTIFIIIAILLVGIIALFFIFRGNVSPTLVGDKPDKIAETYLESCIEDEVQDVVGQIYLNGGYTESKLFKGYDDKNISYLCYNANYYLPCINQEPMFLKHLDDEITNAVSEKVRSCFDDFASALEDEGYTVNARYNGFDLDLITKKILVNIDGEFILTRSGETSTQSDFTIVVPTRIYDLAIIVQEIASQEAEYCSFDTLGYMLLYTDIKIRKTPLGDATKIYSVEDKNTHEKFWFAIRSCAMPGGL